MPVFGKGRKRRERKKFLGKAVYKEHFPGKRVLVRAYGPRQKWPHANTPLKDIELLFSPVFRGKNNFILRRFRAKNRSNGKKKARPAIVVDWGCGMGTAINQLARKYGKRVLAYGYSMDSYKEWAGIRNVKFIHSTKEDLLRYLGRIGKVDLVYSHVGLEYLFSKNFSVEGVEYIGRLFESISRKGKIIFNIQGTAKSAYDSIKKALNSKAAISYEMIGTERVIYITKK